MSFTSFVANATVRPNERGHLFQDKWPDALQVWSTLFKIRQTGVMRTILYNRYRRATDLPISRNSTCDSNLMTKLHEMNLLVSALTQKYMMMVKVERTENEFT